MKKIKIGFVGTGNVFKYYVSALKYNGLFEICGIYDKDKTATEIYTNMPVNLSFEDLLSTNPDIVAILTSSSSRYEIAKRLISKGISVILEKPPVETLAQYDDLLALSLKNSCLIFGALHSRYTSTHIFVRNKIKVTKTGTFHEDLGRLEKIDLNRFDPYIKNGKLREKLPEKTSGLDSWPNILAELALFVDDYRITEVLNLNSSFSPDNIEVRSEIRGEISGGGVFVGKTDWTQGISKKTTFLTFKSGKIILEHTIQKVFIETGGTKKEIADFNKLGDRMESEYLRMSSEIYDVYTKLRETNTAITRKILSDTLDCFERINKEIKTS
jgi:hypothetical protein